MKICRFDENRVGVIRDDRVHDITAHAGHDPLPFVPPGWETRPAKPLEEVRLLAPVRNPGKILAAPVNYKAHIAEMKKAKVSPGHNIWDIEQAGLFLKASSSLVGPSQGIAQRFLDRRTDFEVELVAIIGKEASKVRRQEALQYVAGYCLGLDITVRGSEAYNTGQDPDYCCGAGKTGVYPAWRAPLGHTVKRSSPFPISPICAMTRAAFLFCPV